MVQGPRFARALFLVVAAGVVATPLPPAEWGCLPADDDRTLGGASSGYAGAPISTSLDGRRHATHAGAVASIARPNDAGLSGKGGGVAPGRGGSTTGVSVHRRPRGPGRVHAGSVSRQSRTAGWRHAGCSCRLGLARLATSTDSVAMRVRCLETATAYRGSHALSHAAAARRCALRGYARVLGSAISAGAAAGTKTRSTASPSCRPAYAITCSGPCGLGMKPTFRLSHRALPRGRRSDHRR
jgi:hypothetical protein